MARIYLQQFNTFYTDTTFLVFLLPIYDFYQKALYACIWGTSTMCYLQSHFVCAKLRQSFMYSFFEVSPFVDFLEILLYILLSRFTRHRID